MGQNNVMLWNCDRQGCFNIKKRIKLGEFAECFPGRIAFTDLDAIVDIGGRFLVMEWKGYGVPIPQGQAILFRNLSKTGMIVAIVEGNAETMEVRRVSWWRDGRLSRPMGTDLDGLKSYIGKWAHAKATRRTET